MSNLVKTNSERFSEITGYILYGVCVLGYILNFIAFIGLDFASPYKAEVIRFVGISSPLGCVLGYISIKD